MKTADCALSRRWGADVVLGFGSYGSVAPVIAATMCRIPAAILEPNAVPGLANRILAKFSPRVYLGGFTRFPAVSCTSEITPIPRRRAIISSISSCESLLWN